MLSDKYWIPFGLSWYHMICLYGLVGGGGRRGRRGRRHIPSKFLNALQRINGLLFGEIRNLVRNGVIGEF